MLMVVHLIWCLVGIDGASKECHYRVAETKVKIITDTFISQHCFDVSNNTMI